MLALYRALLHLYPAPCRREFGKEMLSVFRRAQAAARPRGQLPYLAFCRRELVGLAMGALDEHLRAFLGPNYPISLSPRRFTMQPGFRFPKSTAALMTIILAGVVTAIEQAMSISDSWGHGKVHVPPIQPLRFTLFRPFLIPFLLIDVVAALVWFGLYLTHRSGWHRLSELDTEKH